MRRALDRRLDQAFRRIVPCWRAEPSFFLRRGDRRRRRRRPGDRDIHAPADPALRSFSSTPPESPAPRFSSAAARAATSPIPLPRSGISGAAAARSSGTSCGPSRRRTVAFFRGLGVPLHEEPDGKLFPDSNRARDVLDALLRDRIAGGVTLLADHRVLDVDARRGFRVATSRGDLRRTPWCSRPAAARCQRAAATARGTPWPSGSANHCGRRRRASPPLPLDGASAFHAGSRASRRRWS